MLILAIIGVLVLWFCVGFTVEWIAAQTVAWKPTRNVLLMWIEVAIMYGPIGLGILTYEHFESRRWRHR